MIRGYPVLLTADLLESEMLVGIGARYLAFDEETAADLLWARFKEVRDEQPEQATPLALLLHFLPEEGRPANLPRISELAFAAGDPRLPLAARGWRLSRRMASTSAREMKHVVVERHDVPFLPDRVRKGIVSKTWRRDLRKA